MTFGSFWTPRKDEDLSYTRVSLSFVFRNFLFAGRRHGVTVTTSTQRASWNHFPRTLSLARGTGESGKNDRIAVPLSVKWSKQRWVWPRGIARKVKGTIQLKLVFRNLRKRNAEKTRNKRGVDVGHLPVDCIATKHPYGRNGHDSGMTAKTSWRGYCSYSSLLPRLTVRPRRYGPPSMIPSAVVEPTPPWPDLLESSPFSRLILKPREPLFRLEFYSIGRVLNLRNSLRILF